MLHHLGPLAGAAVLTGALGTAGFGVAGLLLSAPLLWRLHRRSGGWLLPGTALLLFAVMFAVSSLVIGPAIRGDDAAPDPFLPAGCMRTSIIDRPKPASRIGEQRARPPAQLLLGYLSIGRLAQGARVAAARSGWRMALAQDALRRDGSTLASVAREVGYGSEFALSAAFRRHVGEAPSRWRERARAAG